MPTLRARRWPSCGINHHLASRFWHQPRTVLPPWCTHEMNESRWVTTRFDFDYFMHADDDSFLRLDLLLPVLESLPRERYVRLLLARTRMSVTE